MIRFFFFPAMKNTEIEQPLPWTAGLSVGSCVVYLGSMQIQRRFLRQANKRAKMNYLPKGCPSQVRRIDKKPPGKKEPLFRFTMTDNRFASRSPNPLRPSLKKRRRVQPYPRPWSSASVASGFSFIHTFFTILTLLLSGINHSFLPAITHFHLRPKSFLTKPGFRHKRKIIQFPPMIHAICLFSKAG